MIDFSGNKGGGSGGGDIDLTGYAQEADVIAGMRGMGDDDIKDMFVPDDGTGEEDGNDGE